MFEEFDEEYDPFEDAEIIRAKWIMDGSLTLGEAAGALRGFANDLITLEGAGWQLISPVEDDYGFILQKELNA